MFKAGTTEVKYERKRGEKIEMLKILGPTSEEVTVMVSSTENDDDDDNNNDNDNDNNKANNTDSNNDKNKNIDNKILKLIIIVIKIKCVLQRLFFEQMSEYFDRIQYVRGVSVVKVCAIESCLS